MASVPKLCFNRIRVDGLGSALLECEVPQSVLEHVLCKLPMDVARKVLSDFLDLADLVQLDSAALIHDHRNLLLQAYRGITVAPGTRLEVNLSMALWLRSRALRVQNMRINGNVVQEWADSFSSIMQETTHVCFQFTTALDRSKMSDILSNCRNLTFLGVRACTVDADVLQTLIGLCPLLQEIDLAYTNARFSPVELVLLSRILSLNLTCCQGINDDAVVALTASCANLKTLILNECKHCTPVSLDAISGNCPQLQGLGLQYWNDLPDDSMMALATGCPDLRSLQLSYCRTLSTTAVPAFAGRLTKLVDVNLCPCINVAAHAIAALVASCPELRIVNLRADDSVLLALSQHCPHLTDVTLDNTLCQNAIQWINGDPLAAILRNCPHISNLTVSAFTPLPTVPAGDISSSVEVLRLVSDKRHAEHEVVSLLSCLRNLGKLQKLWKLDLQQCLQLGDETLLVVAYHSPLLQEVHLDGMSQLTDASIIALAQRCPLLRKINLRGCTLLTDAAVIAIAQRCRLLTHLNLDNYNKYNTVQHKYDIPHTAISDASLAELGLHSHHLRYLNVYGHRNVSKDARGALERALPRCKSILMHI